ncbi:sodium:proton antiporter [Meiothermus taiwanensis]|uniref:Na(+)/H(+) antiporter subunit C1 n=2 Tax=Meiothermus taiwanensis TaxID=172827 RepID=A0A399DS74_9DEIN|nr:NADH-quinone oxidoreductase subunit K [Meiothermus taiwanensis]AWR85895.1 NADH-ubiquinone oxidoreductase chain 4L [Meiothermus taiwanensis WR-220]KIQ53813.1 monovalent cation/H+ antiporter subunit C [Meiothermus taiwanensis]KZK15087.1 cation:proton antiporter [Meiothermus taiwanensis]RIH75085.1 Na(+)/H(+) antiporter subunit C1 [Meiothermus taiwanensis]
MEILLAFLVGGLAAVGVYLMLRPHLIQFLIGFLVLGNAANLLIFTAGRLGSQFPPLVQPSGAVLEPYANPLPQALILTAIVIGFALAAFGIVLFYRAQQALGTLNAETILEAPDVSPAPSPVDELPTEGVRR